MQSEGESPHKGLTAHSRDMNCMVGCVWSSSCCTPGIQDNTSASSPGRVHLGMRTTSVWVQRCDLSDTVEVKVPAEF